MQIFCIHTLTIEILRFYFEKVKLYEHRKNDGINLHTDEKIRMKSSLFNITTIMLNYILTNHTVLSTCRNLHV